jgi:hypothetical protein
MEEAVQVIPAAAPASVDKTPVDNADKSRVIDSEALEAQLESELS